MIQASNPLLLLPSPFTPGINLSRSFNPGGILYTTYVLLHPNIGVESVYKCLYAKHFATQEGFDC
jgi:hypothetical protein